MDIIQSNFSEIMDKPCWGLKYDRQTNLSLNFGNPFLRIEEPFEAKSESPDIREHFASRRIFVNSDYFLLIYIARWKIIHEQTTLATNRSSFLGITKAIGKLKGQILKKVTVNKNTGMTNFDFDLGSSLLVQRWSRTETDELWSFHKPDKYVLSVYSNGFYSYQLGTDKNEKIIKL
jgi:hypothetical protein